MLLSQELSGRWEIVDDNWQIDGNDTYYNGDGNVIFGSYVIPNETAKLIVNEAIQIIAQQQEISTFTKITINEYGVVLKTFKMYLNLPNDDLSFSLSNTAQN